MQEADKAFYDTKLHHVEVWFKRASKTASVLDIDFCVSLLPKDAIEFIEKYYSKTIEVQHE